MAKITKQELMQKVSDNIKDNDDLVISLLEDIQDSMEENNIDDSMIDTLKKENEELKYRYEDLKQKYRERFLNSEIKDEPKDEELEEKEIIDIKEI